MRQDDFEPNSSMNAAMPSSPQGDHTGFKLMPVILAMLKRLSPLSGHCMLAGLRFKAQINLLGGLLACRFTSADWKVCSI